MKNPAIIGAIILSVLFLVVYGAFDLADVPTKLGIDMGNINTDILAIVVNVVVVIALYAITYLTIDRRQMEKEDNSKKTGKILLKDAYTTCLGNLQVIEKEGVLKACAAMPNPDGPNPAHPTEEMLKNSPFESNNMILQLASEGNILPEDLETYLTIQVEFKTIILLCILARRLKEFDVDKDAAWVSLVNERKDKLESRLKKLIGIY